MPFRLWYHMIPLALLGLFSVVELGLTGEWVRFSWYSTGKVGFTLFVSIWTFLSLLVHWTFPFIVAGAWAAFTTLLWLIAAAVISSGSCTNVDGVFRVCFGGYSRWTSMVAFAWINFILTAVILGCIWWYAMTPSHERKDADFQGIQWLRGVVCDAVYHAKCDMRTSEGLHAVLNGSLIET
ncbi:hypothetical protein P389DRAFT_55374 [Cystobasidium minutum MCA 4210]|uniref:uncharacterized protein n=1 Tax=Cystobasidium minutum MCA 4210 TaxID=1397322 RepID=UPI0034CECAA5|eukprot:jgi/Rhomi1/55374/CE55373_292